MGRQPCCDKIWVKKGPWTSEEDKKLMHFMILSQHGPSCCWRAVPKLAGLRRCGKSCRLRWINYLRPDLKRGLLTNSEENLVIQLHARLGNKWSKIAARLPGRTDNEIKNYWNTHIKKKLLNMGIDPITHKPRQQHETESEELEANEHELSEVNYETMINNVDQTLQNSNEISNSNEKPPSLTSNQNCYPIMDDQINIETSSSHLLTSTNCLLEELVDITSIWDLFPVTDEDNYNTIGLATSWDTSLSWLLDCQDFGTLQDTSSNVKTDK